MTQPWEGRVLPLNHTRQRLAVYVLLALFASLWSPLNVAAQTTDVNSTSVHVDESLSASGWTLRLPDGANLTLFPGVVPANSDVTWSTETDVVPALPSGNTPIGSIYHVTISGAAALNTATHRLALALPDSSTPWQKNIWIHDRAGTTWDQATTKRNATSGKLQGGFAALDADIVVAENHQTEQGIASWYCRTSCSKRYPKLHGTSNDFPVGSKVRVTNIANNASVVVTIVSRWGQPAGRVIDLSGAAYDTLKAKNKGLTEVTVSSVLTPPTTVATPATPTAETYPTLKPTRTGTVLAPTVSGSAYAVYDPATATVLAEQAPSTVAPIASLTKLMTAMVVLDTNPDMNRVVTYGKADVTPYAYLQVKPGEQLRVKDLFYAMLVGSANNAATALVRSTGMTSAQFVAAMNAKAASWGLRETTYVDVHGLDPKNVSTADDLAVIASHAFHDYPLIQKASVTASYSFTTVNTKKAHTIKTTDKLLLAPGGLAITGNKTGYLDEALYTYALRVKNSQGVQLVVIVLGEPTSAKRFSDAAALAKWAWKTYTWN